MTDASRPWLHRYFGQIARQASLRAGMTDMSIADARDSRPGAALVPATDRYFGRKPRQQRFAPRMNGISALL
ncbi:MAG: hypothetical protein LC798_18495 [Chloroflexi bacterium]|nr:hypothetical protein [Chloroflexota bacterium]